MEKSEMCRFREWTKSLLAMAASLVACGAAAKDLTWTGATGANWDTSSQNWVLTGTSTPTTFANGDNVTFDDSCAVAPSRSGGANLLRPLTGKAAFQAAEIQVA